MAAAVATPFRPMTRTSTSTSTSASTSASASNQHQHQGPRKGPLGGDCVTVQEGTQDPTQTQDPAQATVPPSMLDLLLQLAGPSSNRQKDDGFGFSLTPAQQIAYSYQYEHGLKFAKEGRKPSWAKYSKSQKDEYSATPNEPAFAELKNSVLVPSVISPKRVDVEGAKSDAGKRAKLAQTCAALALAGLLLRDGKVTIGRCLLLLQANQARFKSQAEVRVAVQIIMPGVRLRWHDNGELQIDPAQRLEPNALSKPLADRADYDIGLQVKRNQEVADKRDR